MFRQLCLLILLNNVGNLFAHGGKKRPGRKAGVNAGVKYDAHRDWGTYAPERNAFKKREVDARIRLARSSTKNDCCYATCIIAAMTVWASFGTWMVINNSMKAR